MAFETDFLSLMDTSVGIESRASTDGFGAITWNAPVSIPAHVTYKMRRVLSPSKEMVVSTVQLQCPPPGYVVPQSNVIAANNTVPQIRSNDRILLPDGTVRHVLNVIIYTDDTGSHHQSVALQ